MIGMEILQPVVALMIWTMIIWFWMYATRIPAMNKSQRIILTVFSAVLLVFALFPPWAQWVVRDPANPRVISTEFAGWRPVFSPPKNGRYTGASTCVDSGILLVQVCASAGLALLFFTLNTRCSEKGT